MLFPLLTIFDFSTVRANFIKPIKLNKIVKRSKDFALLVPIFNDVKYLSNVEFLKKYSSNVILCTTTNETPEFMASLYELSQKYGFRVSASEVGEGKKNPWAIYNKTLLAHDLVLKSTIGALKEKYVIFIDGDTYLEDDLEILPGAMEQYDYDIASVKVLPSRRKTVMENLQGIEYDIAMQARLIYPWLTSGAGMIAKREIMISIMKNHSLFFNGGDVEIGKLADMMGYKVGHIPIIFYTEVPSTFKAWSKQRFSWMCGMFRHSIINIDQNLKHPFHFIYYSFVIYFLIPFKVYEMIVHPYLIPIILALYLGITYFSNWSLRSKWMLLFPFYALFQIIVLVWFGIYRYVKTVFISKNIGKIKMRHNPKGVSFFSPQYFLSYAKNYAIISLIIFAICATSVDIFQKYIFGRPVHPVEMAHMAAENLYLSVRSQSNNVAMTANDQWGDPQVAGAKTENEEEIIE